MQAAMRLRKLGTTQSVVFFAPVEVHQAILDSRTISTNANVDSGDVIRWILSSTAAALEGLVPLYWSNGANFLNRAQASWDNSEFLYDPAHTQEFLDKVREKEKLTLNRLYKPRHTSKVDQELKSYITAPHLKAMFRDLNKRRHDFQDTGAAVHASALEVCITDMVNDEKLTFHRKQSKKRSAKWRWKSRLRRSGKGRTLPVITLIPSKVFTQKYSHSSRQGVSYARVGAMNMPLQHWEDQQLAGSLVSMTPSPSRGFMPRLNIPAQ
jgi:hypothetical protein